MTKAQQFEWEAFFPSNTPHIAVKPLATGSAAKIAPHSHGFIEIVFVIQGRLRHRTIHGWQNLHPGDAVFLGQGAWHELAEGHNLLGYNCCFAENILVQHFPHLREDAALTNMLWKQPYQPGKFGVLHGSIPPKDLHILNHNLDNIEKRLQTPRPPLNARLLGELLVLLSLVAEHITPRDTDPQAQLHLITKKCLSLIDANISAPWTLTTLAQRLRVNKSYLARQFRAEMNMTVMDFVIQRKMGLASTLLVNTDLPIGKIASLAGWDDVNYFARRFKQYFHMSATHYRRITAK